MKQNGPNDQNRLASGSLLNEKTPGEIRLDRAVFSLDALQPKALEELSDLLEKENSAGVVSDEIFEKYFKIIPEINKIMEQIAPLLIQPKSEERDKKLGELCLKKAEIIGKLPTSFGIQEKVKKIVAIDGFEII
jgi:hypothetical protein